MSNLIDQIKKLPDAPGVYFFKDGAGKILYIGKATSLRDRVRSYFGADLKETRGPLIVQMIERARKIGFIETGSVLEALVLEAELIRKYKPAHNTDLKDDKSFNYVVITKEDFPRVLLVRGHNLDPKEYKEYFGPFPNGGQLKEAMRLVRKIFSFRDKCVPNSGRPCFNAQIGLCPGVCIGTVDKKEYAKIIRNIILFFRGKKKDLLNKLEKEMKEFAKKEEFEKASEIKQTIFALSHIHDVSLLKKEEMGNGPFRVEGYDIAHMSGTNTVGVMTVVSNGEAERGQYRKFRIRNVQGVNDTAHLKEVLERRVEHPEWKFPNLIVVDGGIAQKNAAEFVLKKYGFQIPVVGVVKDEHHHPKHFIGGQELVRKHEKEILLSNNEAHRFAIEYHKKLREKLP